MRRATLASLDQIGMEWNWPVSGFPRVSGISQRIQTSQFWQDDRAKPLLEAFRPLSKAPESFVSSHETQNPAIHLL